MVALGQVRVLVNQDGPQLRRFEGGHQPVGKYGDGAGTARQAVCHRRIMVDDHGAGPVVGRRGQEGQEFAVAPALPLDLVIGQQQREDEVRGQQRRRREREDMPEAERRGGRSKQHHARQRAQAGDQVVAHGLEAVDQHGADHGQPAGQAYGLPQHHGRKGVARRPAGARKKDRYRPRQYYRQDRQEI
jgi:hypothetical protein